MLQALQAPELMQRLSLEQDLQSVLACRLLALTRVRTAELCMVKFEEIDSDVWRILAGKMTRKRDHLVVPLSRQAQTLLKELQVRSRGSEYVFPAEHRDDRLMSENTALYLLWRMGYRGRMTGHGWRTIASTWANERGFNRDAVKRQLSHAPDDKGREAYNRAEYLPDRRAMLHGPGYLGGPTSTDTRWHRLVLVCGQSEFVCGNRASSSDRLLKKLLHGCCR